MKAEDFIYSNKWTTRLSRHVLFWTVWYLFLFINGSGLWLSDNPWTIVLIDMGDAAIRLIPQIPFCYFAIYYLIPKVFAQRRYLIGTLLLFLSLAACSYLQYLFYQYVNPFQFFLGSSLPSTEYVWKAIIMLRYHSGPIVCGAIIGSIKFLKVWYLKQQANVELKRENAVAELQLLKAQIHPHFLFNTLNNIYSFTLAKSAVAADLIEKLSEILRYMILQGERSFVPLTEEITLIQNYIGLEKVRYGNRLDISVKIEGNASNKIIAPLLMIPFIENSFKHGSSKMLQNPKLRLFIKMENNDLHFELCNNKPLENGTSSTKGGIGLKNVKKRLELLYPGKNLLKIESTESTFIVKLNIVLQAKNEAQKNEFTVALSPNKISPYAHS